MMRKKFEYAIRRTANSLGVDIRRYRPSESLHARLCNMLENNGVNLVLDVGANIGQFAIALRRAGFEGDIVSFEPLTNAYQMLEKRSAADPNWTIAPRVAIGPEVGTATINVSKNSFSSSILQVLPQHIDAAPESASVTTEKTQVTNLDAAAEEYVSPDVRPFIKIDAQGYEHRILDGAPLLLSRASGLHMELSFVPLYENQHLFDELVRRVKELDFEIWGIWQGIHDPVSGRMLQVDATFFRA